MGLRDEVIRHLADGHAHSGAGLAADLGVSRSAVWKHVRQLGTLGLAVHAVAGRGYQLRRPLELLDRGRLVALLDPVTAGALESLELLGVTDSTSCRMLEAPVPPPGRLRACFAEFQTGGRGRRGRQWFSPYGSGLCLSVSWCFDSAPRDLPALSLAVGLAVRRALDSAGATGLQLKWPNDVVREGHKLAGTLVDVSGESGGPLKAVIGAGVNLTVPPELAARVAAEGGLPPGGLDTAVPGCRVDRHGVAAGLLDALYRVLIEFSYFGFAPFADEWRRCDQLLGRRVAVHSGAERYIGTAAGISANGALLLDRGGEIAAVLTGEVTVREAV